MWTHHKNCWCSVLRWKVTAEMCALVHAEITWGKESCFLVGISENAAGGKDFICDTLETKALSWSADCSTMRAPVFLQINTIHLNYHEDDDQPGPRFSCLLRHVRTGKENQTERKVHLLYFLSKSKNIPVILMFWLLIWKLQQINK